MQILSDPKKFEEKEQLYISVRDCEGRIYTDEELLHLPEISGNHKYYLEWEYRKKSFLRLKNHLNGKFKGERLNVLDIGCGNGWMSNQLNKAGHNVTGLDVNMVELEQAGRVFGSKSSLRWVYGDILDPSIPLERYDVIILAASCQYFPNLSALTERLKGLLNKGGEVHLIDSMFYTEKELIAAKQRSVAYYTGVGYPQMSKYYHHHGRSVAKGIGYRKFYPAGLNIFNSSPALEWWVLNC